MPKTIDDNIEAIIGHCSDALEAIESGDISGAALELELAQSIIEKTIDDLYGMELPGE